MTIVVSPVNDPPVAVNDTVNVSEDTPLNFGGSNLPAGITPVHWSVNGHHYALVLGPVTWHTAKAAELMARPIWDLALLEDLSVVMRDSSICGLGQAAPNPIDCVVKYFPHELQP